MRWQPGPFQQVGARVGADSAPAHAAALAQAAVAPPDLLLLDAQLIDGSGFDLARRLKAMAQTSPAPIIFLADPGHPEHLVQALECRYLIEERPRGDA